MFDDFNVIFTFLVLASVFIALLREKIEPHLAALIGMGALLASGAIDTNDVLSVFSNSAPFTIACMFIISAALDRTGVVDFMGRFLLKLSGKNVIYGIIAMIAIVIFLSAFMNNTPIVVILAPAVITLAQKLKHYPSKYLIPLSYAAILGGTCTLIGTSTNIIVDGIAREYGQPAFSMFEITHMGIIYALIGVLYLGLVGRFLLPERMPPKDEIDDLSQRKRFVAEAIITADSPLIGKTLNEVSFTDSESYEIIDLVRRDSGSRLHMNESMPSLLARIRNAGKALPPPNNHKPLSRLRDIPLEIGDRLVFKADKDELVELKKHIGVVFDTARSKFSESFPGRPVIVAEGVIPPNSDMVNKRIKDLRLRRRYNCFVVGLHRMDQNVTGDLGNTALKENDTLILEGPEEEIARMFNTEQILSATQIRQRSLDRRRAPIALVVILAIATLSALNVMPIAGLSFIGAIIVLITGCITTEHAYKAVDWRILILIFSMLGIGIAMENTGAMSMLVNSSVDLARPLGPYAILAIVYFIAMLLTEIVTNNAIAIVMTPVVIGLATSLGLDPRPFIVAVMFAASASFATPIGYQTNTFVYAAGGYKFRDFMKVGIPLNIILWLTAIITIPLLWPF